MNDVKYIVETKEFIVNGQVIKESSLTEEERKKLIEQSKKLDFLVGSQNSDNKNLII